MRSSVIDNDCALNYFCTQLCHLFSFWSFLAAVGLFDGLRGAVSGIGVTPGDRSFQGRGENQTPGITLRIYAITVPAFHETLNAD